MEIAELRNEFPITKDWIFLDNAGAVPLPVFVTNAMVDFIDRYYSEGITDHWPLLLETVQDCQEKFSNLIGAKPSEVALVGSTSEGLNIVANMIDVQEGDNIVITNAEFPSNLFPWLNLRRNGIEVRIAPTLGSSDPVGEIEQLVDANTRVLATSHVSFTNGLKLDLSALSDLAHSVDAYLVVDAVQSAGVVPIDVEKVEVDFLACSGFKWLMAPSGTGVFYCREKHIDRFTPAYISWFSVKEPFNFVPGNPMQLADDARRFTISGNINLIGYQGLRKSLEYILDLGVDRIWSHVDHLCNLIREFAHSEDIRSISPTDKYLQGPIVNLEIPEADKLVSSLREDKIYTVQRLGGIRISPHIYNTIDEIYTLIEKIQTYLAVQG